MHLATVHNLITRWPMVILMGRSRSGAPRFSLWLVVAVSILQMLDGQL